MAYMKLADAASRLAVAKLVAVWETASPAEFKQALAQELSFGELPFPHLHANTLGF